MINDVSKAINNFQDDFCQKAMTIPVRSLTNHQLVEKQMMSNLIELKSADTISLTFLITMINRQSVRDLSKYIIPKMDTSWKIDSSSTVTVAHYHLYPHFDALLQKLEDQFET